MTLIKMTDLQTLFETGCEVIAIEESADTLTLTALNAMLSADHAPLKLAKLPMTSGVNIAVKLGSELQALPSKAEPLVFDAQVIELPAQVEHSPVLDTSNCKSGSRHYKVGEFVLDKAGVVFKVVSVEYKSRLRYPTVEVQQWNNQTQTLSPGSVLFEAAGVSARYWPKCNAQGVKVSNT